MTDMDKLCNGCILYEEHLKGLDNYITCLGYMIKDTECPCIDCLVKMMCTTTCEKLIKTSWWDEYSESRRDDEEIICDPIEP